MTDQQIISRIRQLVGCDFPHLMRDGQCVELSLESASSPYQGLIRHHPTHAQQDILQLVCRLSGLSHLNLRWNNIGAVPEALGALHHLEHLILGSNKLKYVPPPIARLHRLRSLHLGSNDIGSLPGWMSAELPELRYLTLHKNFRIRSIDPLRGMRTLENLNLFFITLTTLPEFLYENRRLSTLTLWGVRDFPAGLDDLPELQYFSLCGSMQLRRFPPGFERSRSLRMSRLHQNCIAHVPDDIGAMTNLEQLSLYQNEIVRLPESMTHLSQLQKLNLGWNRIDQFPQWLTELPMLRWLGIFDNPATSAISAPTRPGLTVVRERPFTSI